MNQQTIPVVVRHFSGGPLARPTGGGAGGAIQPRLPVAVRVGTMDDLPFIDRLQKAHSKELGFLPRMALEGKVKLGQVLIAEVVGDEGQGVRGENAALTASPSSLLPSPAGYLIAADRYFKRDEVGYVTQVNVVPEHRRSLVAGALLQAQFDRSAYGCKLYCCWCAQDLAANEFWEAMGFVPIAFRTGSRTKGKGGTPRIHLFWQKRIRAGDVSTPWWYPSQTGGGELREDRLVFPIPPGVGWRDVLPAVLPKGEEPSAEEAAAQSAAALAAAEVGAEVKVSAKLRRKKVARSRVVKQLRGPRMPGGLWFADDFIDVTEHYEEWAYFNAAGEEVAAPKKVRPKPAALDPRLTALARNLRDHWAERAELILAPPAVHDVRRSLLEEAEVPALQFERRQQRALPEAA